VKLRVGQVWVTRSLATRTRSRWVLSVLRLPGKPLAATRICYSVGTNSPRWCSLRDFQRWAHLYGAIATRTRRKRSLTLRSPPSPFIPKPQERRHATH
jgi:hypothetical protein